MPGEKKSPFDIRLKVSPEFISRFYIERKIFGDLEQLIFNHHDNRFIVLYGERGSGKTALIENLTRSTIAYKYVDEVIKIKPDHSFMVKNRSRLQNIVYAKILNAIDPESDYAEIKQSDFYLQLEKQIASLGNYHKKLIIFDDIDNDLYSEYFREEIIEILRRISKEGNFTIIAAATNRPQTLLIDKFVQIFVAPFEHDEIADFLFEFTKQTSADLNFITEEIIGLCPKLANPRFLKHIISLIVDHDINNKIEFLNLYENLCRAIEGNFHHSNILNTYASDFVVNSANGVDSYASSPEFKAIKAEIKSYEVADTGAEKDSSHDEDLDADIEPEPSPLVAQPSHAKREERVVTTSDRPTEKDHLDFSRYVKSFSQIFAAVETQPPLCVGLFGDWGAGKSSFMLQMKLEIESLSRKASRQKSPSYHTNISHIYFNAWHYVDANLYASLVSHIFEKLSDFIHASSDAEARQKFYRGLETTRILMEDAKKRTENIDAEISVLTKKIAEAHEKAKRKEAVFKARQLEKQKANFLEHLKGEAGAQLRELFGNTKYSGLLKTFDDVQKEKKKLETFSTRLNKFLSGLTALRWGWALVVAAVTCIVFAPLAGSWASKFIESSGDTIANLIRFPAISLGLVTFFNSYKTGMEKAFNAFEVFESAYKKSQENIAFEDDELKDLNLELLKFREEGEAAKSALENARKKYAAALEEKAEIERLPGDPVLLGRFIRQRLSQKDYEKHLGIISLIRKDLEKLDTFLAGERKADAGKTHRPVDRIILYIDDLDRCPADRVVEVLQAVHLFLAFKLFIVVVAVDPRWLFHSLKKQYPILRARRSADDKHGYGDSHRMSTPQDYLEKIFQIPFHLPVMQQDNADKLINEVFCIKDSQIQENDSTESKKSTEKFSPSINNNNELNEELNGTLNEFIKHNEMPKEKVEFPEVEEAPPIVQALTVKELATVKDLYYFIPTPRALKRFAILYRLLRVSSDRNAFIGNDESPGEYVEVMLLLAVLTGFPDLAPKFFREVAKCGEDEGIQKFAERFLPRFFSDENPKFWFISDNSEEILTEHEKRTWEKFHSTFTDFLNKDSYKKAAINLKTLKKYVEDVSRYSYRDCRLT